LSVPDEQQQPKRRVYFLFPMGWSEMSDADKDTWAEQADALITASPDAAGQAQSRNESQPG
jgi:hypothetical protein